MRVNRGNVDLFTSRRTCFNKCCYWHLNESWTNMHPNEIAVQKQPTGHFFANEEDLFRKENQIVAGSFMFESSNVTLSTSDFIPDLEVNDLVKYNDQVYRVSYIRKQPLKKQKQYSNTPSYKTYIALKG